MIVTKIDRSNQMSMIEMKNKQMILDVFDSEENRQIKIDIYDNDKNRYMK